MGDGQPIDDWGRYLKRMTSRPGWSIAELARRSGIHRATIFGWIKDGGESVSISSVRAVAAALEDDLATALLAAGNLLSAGAADTADEREIRKILQSNIPHELKAHFADLFRRRQEEDRQRRQQDLRLLAQAAGVDLNNNED
jgi:transcriptional regulator with XRE-family HTH domain